MLKNYIGCKIVSADKMTLGEFNKHKGIKTKQDDDTEGYFILYPDGYSSWCPAETFESVYRDLTNDETQMVYGIRKGAPAKDMSTFVFGTALMLLNSGKKVARKTWKNAYLFLPKDMSFASDQDLSDLSDVVKLNPCIAIKNEDDSILIGWTASQTDMLAEDWYVVNG